MIKPYKDGFQLVHQGHCLLEHTSENPAVFLGHKDIKIAMDKGEFDIDDQTTYVPSIVQSVRDSIVAFDSFQLTLHLEQERLILIPNTDRPIRLRLPAKATEQIFGLGEHFTSLNLRNHVVKNWVEEHITRGQIYNKIIRRLFKLPPKTWKFEAYKTYFIVPSFISSFHYFCHVDTDGYGTFDFRQPTYHELSFIGPIRRIVFSKQQNGQAISADLCRFHGRMPKLPDWVHDGMILGIQGGPKRINEQLQLLHQQNAKINAIWAQDWCGELFTYFGKQVVWNWEVDPELYPNLQEHIRQWADQGIAFLGYVNPYLSASKDLFREAKENDYLVKNSDGSVFLTQATSFQFGIVDLTNPTAAEWFQSLIKRHLIDIGMKGWMADFGEYLPTSCNLHTGTGELAHNTWPDLWIALNRKTLEDHNAIGKLFFFNRAGYNHNMQYSTMIWNGDQHVDFTNDFGMKSAIRAMLSLSFSGVGYSHSDVGGYTTVPGVKRSKELYLRWLETNTFSPLLRSHEGNRPWSNVQPYSDEKTIFETAKHSNVHAMLKPYIQFLEQEYQRDGTPMIRPTFWNYDFYSEDTYLFGSDIYVVPVMKRRQKHIFVEILSDGWTHIYTGVLYDKGRHKIPCPIGTPPVFYRNQSSFVALFAAITSYLKQING